MIRLIQDFKFSDGNVIQVSQENWDINMTLQDEQKRIADQPLPDPRKQFFMANIYVLLAACSFGEDVPSFDQAYEMIEKSPEDLDNWYKEVQFVNKVWFTNTDHNESQTVTFSDGSSLVVHDGNVPSKMMAKAELEQAAKDTPADKVNTQVFREIFYPKLAACSSGDVPSEEDARQMPSLETNKWYEAVNAVNPDWFRVEHAISKAAQEADLKKNKLKQQR